MTPFVTSLSHVGTPVQDEAPARPRAYVHAAPDRSVLDAVADDEVAMAVWDREVPPAVREAIRTTDLSAIGAIRLTARPDVLATELAHRLSELGASAAAAAIADDAGQLANLYCGVMGAPLLEMRLEQVDGDACRKFHADNVTARLITTYSGPGTQWLDRADACRLAAGQPPERIRQLRAGQVALMKGRLSAPDAPLVHRSPPIAGSGLTRLLLVINPAQDDADDLE